VICVLYDPGRTRTCNLWFRRPTPYPLGHRTDEYYLRPPRKVLHGAFFGPNAVKNTYEVANTSPLCPGGGRTSQPPPISKGGGAVAMIIFHFVDGLRAVLTMIFAMFSARFLQHFYRVFARFLYSFTRCSARLLQYLCKVFCEAFTTYFTSFFARLLQYFYKVFCEAVTVCLQGVQNRCATAVKPGKSTCTNCVEASLTKSGSSPTFCVGFAPAQCVLPSVPGGMTVQFPQRLSSDVVRSGTLMQEGCLVCVSSWAT
jgi:hypothetical protein